VSTHPHRAPRYPLRLAAEVSAAGNRATGMTRNISTGGLCVEVDRPFDEGSTLEVTLVVIEDDVEAEGARTLGFQATVQWQAEGDKGYTHGLKFVSPDPVKLKQLENALKVVEPDA
jgi:hypothetical protein